MQLVECFCLADPARTSQRKRGSLRPPFSIQNALHRRAPRHRACVHAYPSARTRLALAAMLLQDRLRYRRLSFSLRPWPMQLPPSSPNELWDRSSLERAHRGIPKGHVSLRRYHLFRCKHRRVKGEETHHSQAERVLARPSWKAMAVLIPNRFHAHDRCVRDTLRTIM